MTTTKNMVLLKKLWKDSASMIICGRNPNNASINGCNYKILMIKRSSKASFLPNMVAFPGGVLEPQDCQSEWLSFFNANGIASSQFDAFRTTQKPRPFVFDKEHWVHRPDKNVANGLSNPVESLERDVSLRLAAVREIFEEVGILIGQTAGKSQNNNLEDPSKMFAQVATLDDAKHWQNIVHQDPDQFRTLCQTKKVLPDIFSLFEWANWLTPTTFETRRFDTAFYLVALQNQPQALAEASEIQEYLWASPLELIEMNRANEIQMAPPQLYELSRLTNLDSIDAVARFAKQRNRFGTAHMYPVYYSLKDGQVVVYPGDDHFPKNPDYVGETHDYKRFSGLTCEEFRSKSRNIHRSEHTKNGMRNYFNVESSHCHLNPIVAVRSKM